MVNGIAGDSAHLKQNFALVSRRSATPGSLRTEAGEPTDRPADQHEFTLVIIRMLEGFPTNQKN